MVSAGANAFLKPPFLKPDFESGPPVSMQGIISEFVLR